MGELVGLPEWLAKTLFVLAVLGGWLGLGFFFHRRGQKQLAAKRPNPTKAEFVAMLADQVDPAIAEWLWHQALPYFEPLTPHPDDHLLDDAMIDEGDIEQHWWGDFARTMELDETTGPDWPQDWAFTVRNFARWLQLAQREPAPDQPIQRHSPAGT